MADKIKPTVTSRKTGGRIIESRDLTQEYLAKETTRRQMLQRVLLGAGAVLGASALAGCSSDGAGASPVGPTGPARDAGGPPPTTPDAAVRVDAPPPRTTHLVGMGYSDDHDTAVRLALQETVGFSSVRRGQTVFLKVNTNSGDPYPLSTSPDTIRVVVGMLRDLGATVFIGDRSFWGDSNTLANFQQNGIADVAAELSVPLHVFGDTGRLATGGGQADAAGVDWLDLPTTQDLLGERSLVWDGTMRVPTMVAMADHIVNLACMKTHFIATFTMSLKNFIGVINPVDRSRTNNLGVHGARLFRQIAFANKVAPTPTMVILDGHSALITGGPTSSLQERPPNAPAGWTGVQSGNPQIVIASADRVAADVTGVSVLRTIALPFELIHQGRIWANRQIQPAAAAQIGITGPAQYDLSGPSVPPADLATYLNAIMTG